MWYQLSSEKVLSFCESWRTHSMFTGHTSKYSIAHRLKVVLPTKKTKNVFILCFSALYCNRVGSLSQQVCSNEKLFSRITNISKEHFEVCSNQESNSYWDHFYRHGKSSSSWDVWLQSDTGVCAGRSVTWNVRILAYLKRFFSSLFVTELPLGFVTESGHFKLFCVSSGLLNGFAYKKCCNAALVLL